MSTTQKTKLCWNCEGSVSVELENCPYCAVYLGPPEGGDDLLDPPYRMSEEGDQQAPAAPYALEEAADEQVKEAAQTSVDEVKTVALPLAFLSLGTVFFMFGLVLLLFSHQGVLTLHWNGHYWFIYLFTALPMLFLGWRALNKLESDTRDRQSENEPDEQEQPEN